MALDVRETEAAALAYLARQLGERAPRYLRLEAEFDETPLEGEGPAMVFSFDLEPAPGAVACDPGAGAPGAGAPGAGAPGAGAPGAGASGSGAPGAGAPGAGARHYVCGGETNPNYFPHYAFDADDAYSFHLGTQFMLEMAIQKVDAALEPPGARERLAELCRHYARGATLGEAELAALFRCEDEYLGVYRVSLDGEPIYCMGGDCPPGFYRLTQHAPQVVLRLHLGKLIRDEARREPGAGEHAAPG